MGNITLDQDQIGDIVKRVLVRLEKESSLEEPSRNRKDVPESAGMPGADGMPGMYTTVNQAVVSATAAFENLAGASLESRRKMIESMRAKAMGEIEKLSQIAVDETGLGRYEDKLVKNRLAILKTPGTEILEPRAYTGDHGLTIEERAPFGILGSITPCTNPTETVICNAIGMIAGGNAVVFNAHPTAKKTTAFIIGLLNCAIIEAGGPANLLTAVRTPTIESAKELMTHPGVRMLVVTGGPAVVAQAMNSGKKVIAAGPGNPPVVVDETANLAQAGKDVVMGASFDNNIVCVVEKVLICIDSVADRLKEEMKQNGGYELTPHQLRKIEKLVIAQVPTKENPHGAPNKAWVGKNADEILAAVDIRAPKETRLIFFEAGEDHPLVGIEQLMPVMPLVRVKCVDEAITLAKKVEHGFGHTCVMHSTNVDNLSKMARVMDTSIFIKNGMAAAGLGANGEGFTSFTIASPTGEGLTNAVSFTRIRRCTLKDRFRIV